MSFSDFQGWEHAAEEEYETYSGRPVASLIADARNGRYGEYYQLWRTIGARATLPEAGDVLLPEPVADTRVGVRGRRKRLSRAR